MLTFLKLICYTWLLLSIVLTTGCSWTSQPRRLLSVDVTPAVVSAHDFPNGQVHFTALGTFNRSPSPEKLTQANWSISPVPNPPGSVSISEGGVAQCEPGFTGTVTVVGAQLQCSGTSTDACGSVQGTAQMTCP